MGDSKTVAGWQISQVVNLLDMPRRDITRSCYADRKRGGAGILQPVDGSWGRRSYSVEDIAWLYLVELQHDEGYSLPAIAQRMDTSAGVDELCERLNVAAERASEAHDELLVRRERARVLQCALKEGSEHAARAVGDYLRQRFGSADDDVLRSLLADAGPLWLAPGNSPRLDDQSAQSLNRLLGELGVDLAVELWAGPGTFDRLLDAVAGHTGS